MLTLSRNKLFQKIVHKALHKAGIIPLKQEFYGIVRRLERDYGYTSTKQSKKPVDCHQNPSPWFTYPAIEFLSQLDLSEKSIFEWGSGNSSFFFAERAASVISVESDPVWYQYVNQSLKENQQLILRQEEEFAEAIDELSDCYDVIIVDAVRRYDCAAKALTHLKKGGVIILDNSDWYPNTSLLLRNEGNLLEVDMHGFGPINDYSWTTSFYFDRHFNFSAIRGVQPHFSRSALQQQGDDDFPRSSVMPSQHAKP